MTDFFGQQGQDYSIAWRYDPELINRIEKKELFEGNRLEKHLIPSDVWNELSLVSEPEPLFGSKTRVAREQFIDPEERELEFGSYGLAVFEKQEDADIAVARLERLAAIQYASSQGVTESAISSLKNETTSSTPSSTEPKDYVQDQKYLVASADGGVDAVYSWGVDGGDGEGIVIADIQAGWNLSHMDFGANISAPLGSGHFPPTSERAGHGTMSLGVMLGKDDNIGVKGIAFKASGVVLPATFSRHGGNFHWNVGRTLLNTSRSLPPGSVIHLGLHSKNKVSNGREIWVPVDYQEPVFMAIRHIVQQKGIHVVIAAGNQEFGGQDLDTFLWPHDRQGIGSGAIVVGGGNWVNHQTPLSRWSHSNFSSNRVHLQGWAQKVVTAGNFIYSGKFPHSNINKCYHNDFNGTSAATAIVASVVACVSGACKKAGKAISPSDMKSLLIDSGKPQVGSAKHVGPLPDLKSALNSLGLYP